MANTRYVRKSRSGGSWEVVRPGHVRGTVREETKKDAVKAARKLVSRDGGGEVRVMNRTGKIADTKTVGRTRKRSTR
jgi:hypothetical protein